MHNQNTFYTIPALLHSSFEKYGNRPFLSFTDETPLTYAQVREKIEHITSLLKQHQVKKGDKVAILSSNMPNWAMTYFAILSMGAVAVPILPDFSENEVHNVLKHSESKVLFVSELQLPKTENYSLSHLQAIIKINDFSVLKNTAEKHQDSSITQKPVVDEHDLAAIIYTSGTTGNSKGVMLSHKNITHNAISGGILQPISEKDRFLSLLPMSHTYENTLGLILPMIYGSSIYYLKKLPTPAVLIPAMQQIKPTMILAVPLIIEKIYKNKIFPAIHGKKLISSLYKIPFVRKRINKSAGRKLIQTFGGELKFFGIGGSKLNATVEQFLIEAKFPYAIGYGLTETSPLVAGVNPSTVRLQSTGPAIEEVQIKLINVTEETGEGEICVKGPSVMMGYYKDNEATKAVFTEDNWFRTGDLGTIDKDGYVFIKGRLKNVIIGPSGENIYPEEIEALINNFEFVVESLVVEKSGKLVAFVHFNTEELQNKYQHMKDDIGQYIEKKTKELSEELKNRINEKVNRFSTIKIVVPHDSPFEKTPTQKIKRYKYL
jgi:long-chain acyl-CoA synthetase